jgi:hypothetical protein
MIENSHDDIQKIVKEISTVNILDPPDTSTNTESGSGSSNRMNIRNLSLNNNDNIDIRIGDGNQFTANGSPFTINGDINDDDVNRCNSAQIKELRLRFFKENSTYEYLRFLQIKLVI